jgi:hypothetical protein
MKLPVRDHRRDLEILHLRNKLGWTFIRIAEKYSISKVRARQVYERIRSERINTKLGIGA